METGINTLQYLFNGLTTSWLRHIVRHKSLFTELRDVHWTTTLCSGKTPTFVSNITLAFLDRFLYFFYQWKREWILYWEVNKIYNISLNVSPHYLIQSSTFWDDHGWPLPVVRTFDGTVCSQFSQKVVYIHVFFEKNCSKFYISSGWKSFKFS